MSTTYYAIKDRCPHCSRSEDAFAIGQSSALYKFLFFWNDEIVKLVSEGLSYLVALSFVLEESCLEVRDEYGRIYTAFEFKDLVDARQIYKSHILSDTPSELFEVFGEYEVAKFS